MERTGGKCGVVGASASATRWMRLDTRVVLLRLGPHDQRGPSEWQWWRKRRLVDGYDQDKDRVNWMVGGGGRKAKQKKNCAKGKKAVSKEERLRGV